MSIMMYMIKHAKSSTISSRQLPIINDLLTRLSSSKEKPVSPRLKEFREKLRQTTPIKKLDELSEHPFAEKEPLKRFPENTNPKTGEIGGPRGPEPTRYGDWERKGRVSDF